MSLLGPLREAEALLSAGLRAVSVAPEEGAFKGQPVRLVTRAYEGGPFRFVRFIELTGPGLEIGNALCLPRYDVLLPIFGADLVRIGGQPAMIAADLSPVGPADVSAVARGRPALPPGGELPAWARDVFSPFALYTRAGEDHFEEAARAFLAFPRTLLTLAPLPGDSTGAQRRYCRAHLEDDKGLLLLARMFGEERARRFLHDVMFPV